MTSGAPTDAHWADVELPRTTPAMPFVGEWMTPWIVASFLVALLSMTFVLGGEQIPGVERILLTISVGATLTAAALVGVRSNRAQKASERDERSRPPVEALEHPALPLGTAAYVEGMHRWTSTVLELLEHAHGCAPEGSDLAGALQAGIEDAQELQKLLAASGDGDLQINDAAAIHAVCTLWETNEPRLEELAASSDPAWHRRWRARSVADRRLRHGGMVSVPVLPYRT